MWHVLFVFMWATVLFFVTPDVIDDVLIVPISISYDKLVDGNFTKEQMVAV